MGAPCKAVLLLVYRYYELECVPLHHILMSTCSASTILKVKFCTGKVAAAALPLSLRSSFVLVKLLQVKQNRLYILVDICDRLKFICCVHACVMLRA